MEEAGQLTATFPGFPDSSSFKCDLRSVNQIDVCQGFESRGGIVTAGAVSGWSTQQ